MEKERLVTSLFLGIGLLWAGSLYGAAQNPALTGGQLIGNNTPKFAGTAKNLGPEDSSKIIDVSIWLNLHNRGELDALAKELYDRNSPNYRQWLDRAEFAARFAPTASRKQRPLQEFFTAHNMRVVTVGPDNFFVRARGTVGDVQKAFRVEIARFEVNGKIYRGNTGDPYVEGPAGALVQAVYGLDNLEFKHPLGDPDQPRPGEARFAQRDSKTPRQRRSGLSLPPIASPARRPKRTRANGVSDRDIYRQRLQRNPEHLRLRLHASGDPYGLQFSGDCIKRDLTGQGKPSSSSTGVVRRLSRQMPMPSLRDLGYLRLIHRTLASFRIPRRPHARLRTRKSISMSSGPTRSRPARNIDLVVPPIATFSGYRQGGALRGSQPPGQCHLSQLWE